VADRPEIEKELRLALMFLNRKLAAYMSKKGQAEMAKKRANLYSKYIPLIAQFCTELAGKKKEPDYKKMLKEETAATELLEMNEETPSEENQQKTEEIVVEEVQEK
jgi:DNA topoisomerase-6 subunit B